MCVHACERVFDIHVYMWSDMCLYVWDVCMHACLCVCMYTSTYVW